MGTDPWYLFRALGLGIIILLAAGLPTLALAQPEKLDWQNFPNYDSSHPILFLWGTITLATLGRLYASLYKKKDELDPIDLANMPANGINLGQKLHDWYGTFAINKDYTLSNIRDGLSKPERITYDTHYDLKPIWKEELTRMMGHLILRFDELETLHEEPLDQLNEVSTRLRDLMALPDEETLENMLQHTEELLKFAKGIKREFNQWFPEETNTTLDHVIQKLEEHFKQSELYKQDADLMHTYQDRLNDFASEMNFPPTSWVKTTHEIIQDYLYPLGIIFDVRPATLTPRSVAMRVEDGLAAIGKEIPDRFHEKDQNGKILLTKSIAGLRKAVHRLTAGMSGVITTTTTVTETDADSLRNTISPKYFPSSGPLNYDQLLAAFVQLNKERLDAITQGKQPAPGPAPCRHPEDLSLVLTHDDDQSWDDSLAQVQDLLDAQNQHQPAPVQDSERLFSSSDVPKLGDTDDYWTFRRSFEIFASSATVIPRQISAAVARILNRFEGHRRSVMMAYDVNANLRPTWNATWHALLQYMDARFLPTNAHQELYVKWITLRRSDTLWGQSFITEFDRIRMTLNQIAPIKGQAPIDDLTTLSRLMDKLPAPVRETFRNKHRNYESQLLATPPTVTVGQVYDWIVEDWEYLKNMGMLSDQKRKDNKSTPPRSSANNSGSTAPPPVTPANLNPGNTGSRVPLFGECNKPCFDTVPAVPIVMRGPALQIRDRLQTANLCFRCRRSQEEHNGPKIGCQLPGNHRGHNATRRAGAPQPDIPDASSSGNDTGDA